MHQVVLWSPPALMFHDTDPCCIQVVSREGGLVFKPTGQPIMQFYPILPIKTVLEHTAQVSPCSAQKPSLQAQQPPGAPPLSVINVCTLQPQQRPSVCSV